MVLHGTTANASFMALLKHRDVRCYRYPRSFVRQAPSVLLRLIAPEYRGDIAVQTEHHAWPFKTLRW